MDKVEGRDRYEDEVKEPEKGKTSPHAKSVSSFTDFNLRNRKSLFT